LWCMKARHLPSSAPRAARGRADRVAREARHRAAARSTTSWPTGSRDKHLGCRDGLGGSGDGRGGVELTVLGCHAGMPAAGRASSGYLVSTEKTRILLDCGPGVATALSGCGGVAGLDAIFLSHLHPDHCHDLLPIGTTLRRFKAGVRLLGPVGTVALLDRMGRLYGLGSPYRFAVNEYRPGESFVVGDCTLEVIGLRHVVPNCGVRIASAGVSLAYTGDTGRTEALGRLASGVDLLLAEATLAERDDGDYGHLSALDAAEAARDAMVKRLVLTHLGSTDPRWVASRLAEARAVFDGPVELAEPGCHTPVA
jgi:ribonuclease BN (tRNA processing enzyme)